MPTQMMHVAIAKKVNEKLALESDLLYVGCLMTNWTNVEYYKAHFKKENSGPEELPEPDLFIQKYQDKMNNPIVLGYLIHILTDRFWNKYMVNNVYLYNEEQKVIGVKIKRKKELTLNQDTIYELKSKTYNKYDNYLISKNLTDVIKTQDIIIPNLEEIVLTNDELNEKINEYNKQIKDKRKKKIIFLSDNKYSLINQKEFEKNIERCASYIYSYLKKNDIVYL